MGRKREASWMKYYHFVWRCNNRNNTFYEAIIKKTLIAVISSSLAKYKKVKICAITIMDNHIHIIMYAKKLAAIESFSRSVGAGLGHKLHYLEVTSGHIFGERYSLQPIKDPMHLAVSLAYVLNNPVKAGMVENPGDYEYSNFSDLKWNKNIPTAKTSKVSCLINNKARRKMISDKELIQITSELKQTPIDDYLELEPKKHVSMLLLQKRFSEFANSLNTSIATCSREMQVNAVKYLLGLGANRFQIKRITGIGYYTVSKITNECRSPGFCSVQTK